MIAPQFRASLHEGRTRSVGAGKPKTELFYRHIAAKNEKWVVFSKTYSVLYNDKLVVLVISTLFIPLNSSEYLRCSRVSSRYHCILNNRIKVRIQYGGWSEHTFVEEGNVEIVFVIIRYLEQEKEEGEEEGEGERKKKEENKE